MSRKVKPPKMNADVLRYDHVREHGSDRSFHVSEEAAKRARRVAADMAKALGKDVLIRVNEAEERDLTAGGISTGFQEIDDCLTGTIDKNLMTVVGSGLGIPRGRIIEVMGMEASGKTSLALMLAANTQRKGGIVAFIDAEHALDVTYARSLGVDVDTMLLTQPECGEDALDQAEKYVRKGIDLIIVDSVAALVPRKELKKEMGSATMGEQARLMSQACRKLNGLMKPGGPTVVFINQIRMKLGVLFGNPEVTTGGNALKFYASIRCDIRRIKKLMKTNEKDGERYFIGNRVKLETIKNKIASPHRYVIYDILLNRGIRVPTKAQVKKDKLEDQLRFGKK